MFDSRLALAKIVVFPEKQQWHCLVHFIHFLPSSGSSNFGFAEQVVDRTTGEQPPMVDTDESTVKHHHKTIKPNRKHSGFNKK